MDSICYYGGVHLCFAICTFHIRWICYDLLWVKIWGFGFWGTRSVVYENIFERLYWRRDYLKIWRVKCMYHPYISDNSIRSYLICLIKFYRRYIRQIPRILRISSERIWLSSVMLGILFFWFKFSMVCIFWGNLSYFDRQDRVMRNKSFTFLFNVRCVHFNFRGRKFLFRGEEL